MTRHRRALKVAAWVLASPLIVFVGWTIGIPIVVMIYIALSPHPDRLHGDRPNEYSGLFISNDPEAEDQFAVALRPEGRTKIYRGWGETYWHVEGDSLYIDSFPTNCMGLMPLRSVNEYDFEMVGPDKMILRFRSGTSRLNGSYTLVRTSVCQELWDEVERLREKPDFSLRAHRIRLALQDAGVYEDEPTTWDDLEPPTG